MNEATDHFGTAMKHGTVTLLARVVDNDAQPITQAGVREASYSVFLLDDADPDARQPVAGHNQVALAVADVVFDALQHDALWTRDTVGYNFRHTLDVSAAPAFAVAGRRYLVEYRLDPTDGQPIIIRFRINVI